MAVFSPTQDQGLASVRIYWSLFDVFPILWIQTWEWFGKQPCERRSRIPSPSKNSVIELKFGRFFVQFGCSKQQSGKVSHLETPHDILESFKTTSVFGGTVCVCAMSHALLQSGLRRMPFHFQCRLLSTVYLGILSTPGCRTAFRYNGHSMRRWYLHVHPRNGLQQERYWYVEKSSLESSALRTSSSSGLCNGLYGLYLMIIVAPPHK